MSALLIGMFVVTGFCTSFYKHQRANLGGRHYAEGQRLESTGDIEAAVEEYRRALIFAPDDTDYRISFASALIGAGRFEEAASHIDQLLGEDPTNGALNRMRAHLAERQNHTAAAIDYYQRAVYEYWPPNKLAERARARWELINLLERTGRREEAVGELMTLYANTTIGPSGKLDIGFALLRNNAGSEAAQIFRDAARTQPKDPRAHEGLGEAYLASGEFVSARHEFERAIKLEPKDKEAANSLALTNAIIDMDPDLPGVTNAERRRRSTNLLRRVVYFLRQCSGGMDVDDRLQTADNLVKGEKVKSADISFDTLDLAKELWKDRASLCPDSPPSDPEVSRVMDRMSRE
ncbi:MAG: tetratricopeptide repeat protein [Bryobacteraceae bacterium]